MDTGTDLKLSLEYADFWTGGGSIRGLLTAPAAAADDGILAIAELTDWTLNWSGGSGIDAFSIASDTGSATALLSPGGFLLEGSNTAFAADGSDADSLDQGLFESASGDQTIDLGALIVEDNAAGAVAQGDSSLGSITLSPILEFEVDYSGFWADGGSVTGGFSVSEADAADGVVTTDEFVAWNWNWSGNAEVAAFSVSSEDGTVVDLIPLTGFLLEADNTPIDATFADPDGIDQGIYESAAGDQVIDLGALLIQNIAAGTLTQGDATLGSITVEPVEDETEPEPPAPPAPPADDLLIFGNGDLLMLVGDSGSDRLYGSDKAETFLAGAGDDIIYGNGGLDLIDSGSGLDQVWLGGSSNATIILSEGEGYDFIANYQLGQTQFKGFAEADLLLRDGAEGAEIYSGDDLLAIVGAKTVADLSGAFVA